MNFYFGRAFALEIPAFAQGDAFERLAPAGEHAGCQRLFATSALMHSIFESRSSR